MSKKTYSFGFPFNRKELKSEPLTEASPPLYKKKRAMFFICAEKLLKDAEFYSEKGERTLTIEQLEILRRLINKEI
jgi:hypothetical protein